MPTAARTSRAIPTKLRFGSRYPAKESAEVNTTSAATTRSKTPATRAACFSARTSSPPERKRQRTTIADISSTTLSPPKARRAGLCALQAAPSAITVSATIQTMERTSNRRMRRRTSDDTAWSAIFSFDCASDCFLILHPYRIGRGLLTCFAISIHSAQSRTQPLSPQERKSRDTLQLPGATAAIWSPSTPTMSTCCCTISLRKSGASSSKRLVPSVTWSGRRTAKAYSSTRWVSPILLSFAFTSRISAGNRRPHAGHSPLLRRVRPLDRHGSRRLPSPRPRHQQRRGLRPRPPASLATA